MTLLRNLTGRRIGTQSNLATMFPLVRSSLSLPLPHWPLNGPVTKYKIQCWLMQFWSMQTTNSKSTAKLIV